MHYLGGEIAHAARGAGSLLFDVVGHDAVVLVDDVALEAVALAVLHATRATDVGPLTWGQDREVKVRVITEIT